MKGTAMLTVKADFSRKAGPVRPLHGVNQGPMTKVFTYDATEEFREMGVPFCRLHDTEYPYGSGEFVDIPCIFKNFDADENDPASYNFGLTDAYIQAILNAGAQPIYRLGVSIEHAPVKRHIYPPKDFHKWARICEHIIAHYNRGWADGHYWNIQYWEIWNEADGHGNQWLGTAEQFYELYCITAVHLKKCFPEVKIGGCGWTRGFNPYMEGFMKYITSRPEYIPLDFYSWHRYFSKMSSFNDQYRLTEDMLQRYGRGDTESVFDEWNFVRTWDDQPQSYVALKNHIGAAHAAAVLCNLQTATRISLATYFEGDVVKEWCGMFDVKEMSIGDHGRKASVKKLKPFYAFRGFGDMYRLGTAVETSVKGEDLYACGATDGKSNRMMVSYYTDLGGKPSNLRLELTGFTGTPRVFITDERRTDEEIPVKTEQKDGKLLLTLRVKPNTFLTVC